MYSKIFILSLLAVSALADSYTPLPLVSSIQNQNENALQSLDKIESGAPYAPYTNYVDNTNEGGYTVQSGYEGFLVPYEDIEPTLNLLETKGFVAAGLKFIASFPKLALKVFFKAIPHVLFIGAFILIGGALTTAVCSFTSLCSISVLGALPHYFKHFDKEQVRSFVGEDRINAASVYVKSAIDNFYKTHGLKKTGRSKKQ